MARALGSEDGEAVATFERRALKAFRTPRAVGSAVKNFEELMRWTIAQVAALWVLGRGRDSWPGWPASRLILRTSYRRMFIAIHDRVWMDTIMGQRWGGATRQWWRSQLRFARDQRPRIPVVETRSAQAIGSQARQARAAKLPKSLQVQSGRPLRKRSGGIAGLRVLNRRNLNNEYGLPLTLSGRGNAGGSAGDGHAAARRLQRLGDCEPDVGVVTRAPAHLSFFLRR